MPLSDDKKAAWNFVHGIYRNPPVSEQNKKIAWNQIHKVYGGLPLISPMSKAHAPQKEEIPEREVDMGVKPISASVPPAGVSPVSAGGGGGGGGGAGGKISYADGKKEWEKLEAKRRAVWAEWEGLNRKIDAARDRGSPFSNNYIRELGYYRLRDEEHPALGREQAKIIDAIDESTAPKTDIIPDIIRNLKVGDPIVYGQSSGYMGDSGDSRDVGYAIQRRVVAVLGRNRYEVEPQYPTNKPEIFAINTWKDWLKDTNYNRLQVVRINGVTKREQQEKEPFLTAWRSHLRDKSVTEKAKVTEQRKAERVKTDYTKATAGVLRGIIEQHLAKEGKGLRGISTATKAQLLKFIADRKIPANDYVGDYY